MPPSPTLAVSFGSTEISLLIAILVLLLVLAFLAVAETGINRISRVKAQSLVEDGRPGAKALYALVIEPERFINPVLLAVNIVQIAQTILITMLVDRLFGGAAAVVGFIVATFVNVVLVYVFTEAIPKTWAVLESERAALATARPTSLLVAFPPLRWASRALIGLANWILPGKGLKKGPFVSESELLGIVGAAAEDEVIEHEERELIESIIEFGDTVAREIMVPRTDVVSVPATARVTDALDVAIEHGFSRLPVLGDNVDDVLGIAYTKDLMRAERDGKGFHPVAGLLRPAHFMPETKPVAALMREMQTGKFHLAVLVDEYGGIAGIVTLEDCLEELVGDIVDEYDQETPEVLNLGEGELSVDGGLSVDDLSDLLDISLPDEEWDTVAGFVFGTLGQVPTVGDAVEHAGYRFEVTEVDGRRIERVHVLRVPDTAEPGPDHAGEPARSPTSDAAS
jgi:putative hemolysin